MQGKQKLEWNQEIKIERKGVGGKSRPLESLTFVGLLLYFIEELVLTL